MPTISATHMFFALSFLAHFPIIADTAGIFPIFFWFFRQNRLRGFVCRPMLLVLNLLFSAWISHFPGFSLTNYIFNFLLLFLPKNHMIQILFFLLFFIKKLCTKIKLWSVNFFKTVMGDFEFLSEFSKLKIVIIPTLIIWFC